jgi:hypothetical protein
MQRAPDKARRTIATLAALVIATVVVTAGQRARGQGDPGGVLGGPIARLESLNENGPGWLYYGVNAADRGLGYVGSYMTLGGFIPYGEDDLGGLWAADLRGHLSVNGGFFSNVGAVRKQFLGGSLLGIGVYWDYDGDLNQYPVWGEPGTEVFGQFGHAYNQVGVSGEWLTDFGNLRSNGYIPVGTTAHTLGAPGSPFTSNYLLCQYGLDAALSGADLEVGAYIPGLADWAGMISVGGYALGNARYDWNRGSRAGRDVVPWFGGVYTRLDMTFVENWDFSLQANNDSFFDWTGFARLTYRMGGSRRRNVPDQVEQPMMRNEHIVRAHQTPVVAVNPVTNQPWRVLHVDNSAVPGGDGTADAPFQLLSVAQNRATQPYDIVFVRRGNGNPYVSGTTPTGFTFGNLNQALVGEGSTLQLNTASCGYRSFFEGPPGAARPVLTNAGGAGITLGGGAVVDHVAIDDAAVGVLASGVAGRAGYLNDVAMTNVGTGVDASALPATAPLDIYDTSIQATAVGLAVGASPAPIVFQGSLSAPALTNPDPLPATALGNRTTQALNAGPYRNERFQVPYSPVPVP